MRTITSILPVLLSTVPQWPISALTDAALSRLARTLITSFVYSNDVVARLSLGTIRDIRNAAFLLCEANEPGGEKQEGEGYTSVTNRAKEYKAGKSKTPGEMEWVGWGRPSRHIRGSDQMLLSSLQ